MLSTKIHSSFWSDEDVGLLAPEEKLAALWILTNKDMNNIGVLKVSRRAFEFETGSSWKVLEGACKGLARGLRFEQRQGGLVVLALNYVRYQFGAGFEGEVVDEKNRVTKHLRGLVAGLTGAFRLAFLERYPGLGSTLKGLEAPSLPGLNGQGHEGGYKPLEGASTAQHSSAQNSSGEGGRGEGQASTWNSPTRAAAARRVLGVLNERSGSSFLATPQVLAQIGTRLGEVHDDVEGMEKMVARQVLAWAGDAKMAGFLRPATLFGEKFHEYWGQRALPVAAGGGRDRAAQLRGLIEKSPANPSSVYHDAQATPEQKAQLKAWRRELGGLE